MINTYSIAFVVSAATIVAGVDYYDQSSKAGLSLGQMSIGQYATTIPNRFAAAKDEKLAEVAERERKSRWRIGGLPYLPEAPEGWTRRALTEGDDTPIMPAELINPDDCACDSLLKQMEAREKVKEAKQRAKRSWVYERGTETVFVEVKTFERPSTNSLIGLVATTISSTAFGGFDKTAGYAVIGGVGFTEKLDMDGVREHHFRVLEGSIGFGDEVHLRVHANASTKATREILEAIDYDGLNSLLPVPMQTVGNDVTLPSTLGEVPLAKQMYQLRDEFLQLRATEAQYRISNVDTTALLVNTYAGAYAGNDQLMDITGGELADLGTLIEFGYRTAVTALMAGKSADEIKAEVDQMVKTAMMYADAETAAAAAQAEAAPAPTMSPELAAELGQSSQASARSYNSDNMAVLMDDSVSKPSPKAPVGALTQRDDTATVNEAKLVVSKRLPEAKILKLQENAQDPMMQMGLGVAVRRFEEQNNLPKGSCDFSMTNYRVECAVSDTPSAKDKALGFLNSIGLAGDSESAPKPAAKPQRLKLSSEGGSGGKRCVGSFCD